ncbi:MAG: glycerol-3-phosphate dehydrogenase, partial [Proteobacteria bacterium]|nr:glycerol-3-phosphate dehydrogenase [Pseudomonadota bacterium]
MPQADFDICVIGGGINGAGIARDAAGRGLRVLLVEAGDLGGATSSNSTKLIHGGLRYLEYCEFRLVREALKEREVLMDLAPHIIRPMEFILPHDENLRSAWMIRMGLFLYDNMGRRNKLKKSHGIHLSAHEAGDVLNDRYWQAFSYSDCVVDDARLVVANVMDAAERGAVVMPRTGCTNLEQEGNVWRISLRDVAGRVFTRTASAAVNATGPWVRGFLESSGLTGPETPRIRLVKGSHIVVPRLYEGDYSYVFQQPDRRIVFAMPYEYAYTLIGTTEVDFDGDPSGAQIEEREINYLCNAANRSFKAQIAPDQIIWSYSGVRPLLEDENESATAVTRDYQLILDRTHGPPLLSVFGGKITTYRRLSEQAVDELCGGRRWTAAEQLPGGNIPDGNMDAYMQAQAQRYPWLPPEMLYRYAHTYGTRMDVFLQNSNSLNDLGRHLGEGIFEAEVYYLAAAEWARTVEDIL